MKQYGVDFESCWNRIQGATNIKNRNQLSKIIGTTSSNVTKKMQKNVFPAEWAFLVGRKYNLATDWILTGEGSKTYNATELFSQESLRDNLAKNANIQELENDFVKCSHNGKTIKKVPLIFGAKYIVEPLSNNRRSYANVLKGRDVILLDWDDEEHSYCNVICVNNEKNSNDREYATLDICDLKLKS